MSLYSKKLSIVAAFDILRKYSDSEHTLTQKQIRDIMETEYCIEVDRKAIKRNLDDLEGFLLSNNLGGYQLEHKTLPRETPGSDGTRLDSSINSGYYLERDFTEGELRLLVDSILFSKHVDPVYGKQIIDKLLNLGSIHLRASFPEIKAIATLFHSPSKELFYTLEELGRAIKEKKKVSFTYCEYGLDKKLHPKRNDRYLVNPCKLIASNSHYYLLGYMDSFDNYVHFRIDKIQQIEITDAPINKKQMSSDVSTGEYLSEHSYMHSGQPEPIVLEVSNSIIGDVLDHFGDRFTIQEKKQSSAVIRLRSNLADVYYWALQYGDNATIIEPQELRDSIRMTVESMYQRYTKSFPDRLSAAIQASEKSNVLRLRCVDTNNGNSLKNLKHIECVYSYKTLTESLSYLSEYDHCERLILMFEQDVSDFLPITEMKSLRTLGLYRNGIRDISFLLKCGNLKSLSLDEPDVEDCSPLYEMANLHSLYVTEEMDEKIDLGKLSQLNPNLRVFHINAWSWRGNYEIERIN